ncbi:matrixin family metalloprotease [Cellulomonas edaphi]|uniref:Matrixin family metalloprotease n=1 Tax=Cellulomonas edaphi TaxID=3053468 RepID=A0ABT7SA88_9CELL|nr:matrixin family metalloprotease [Cellulomons edaphi]MDM7832545.1 matrixin family metalloprotease [Cellulomons edaphi]
MPAPDDLPRSPTGRIPQWVIDEAACRVTTSTEWRTSSGAPGAVPPQRRSWRARRAGGSSSISTRSTTLIAGLVVLVVVVGGLAAPGGWAGVLSGHAGVPAGSSIRPPAGFEEAEGPLGHPPTLREESPSYAFLGRQTGNGVEGGPVTWSPCRPIHYVVRTAGAPARFASDVAAVFAELEAATGLHVVDDGVSDEAVGWDRQDYQPDRYGKRWAPVLVEFASAAQVPELAGPVGGVGGARSYADRTTGRISYITGTAIFDSDLLDSRFSRGVSGEPAYMSVLRHELGHVLGLEHVDDPTQLMNPEAVPGITTFQAGDLTGLALLGAGGCAPGL